MPFTEKGHNAGCAFFKGKRRKEALIMSATKDRLMDICEFVRSLGFSERLRTEMSSMHEELMQNGNEDAAKAMLSELGYRFGNSKRAERFLTGDNDSMMPKQEDSELDIITEAYLDGMTDAYDYAACFAIWACEEYRVKVPDTILVSGSKYERFCEEPYSPCFNRYCP